MALMGLDLGTTGVKCTITDNMGQIISAAYQEYETLTPADGEYELDPEIVWQSTKKVISESNSFVRESILAVSVSSFGEAFVMVDKAGKPLMNTLLQTDSRGTDELDELINHISTEKIREKTGLNPAVTFAVPKIMWIKRNRPDVYRRTHLILLYGSYILYRLGGVSAIDYTLAARSLAFNVSNNEWDKDILEAANIDEKLLPTPHRLGTVVGDIDPNLAQELGLNTDIKLVTGAHDQICVAIGSGAINEGDCTNGMGSVDNLSPIFKDTSNLTLNAKNNYPTIPYLNDTYTTVSYVYDGGTSLKWFRDTFGNEEVNAANMAGVSVYNIFDKTIPKEPTKLLVLPHFSGAAVPYFDEASRGMILGISGLTKKPDIYRALMEGVAFEQRINMENMATGGIKIKRLLATGGGSRSDVWLQIKADVLNTRVERVHMKESGTLGVIIMAGVAIGLFDSFESAMSELTTTDKYFEPIPENVAYYSKQFKKYLELYNFNKKLREI
ncbi:MULTISPECIES: FGGY-family carbohydrate kinase [Enterococcaceae]|uniref:FGGY-family carbohydrate kinase n=1 Tax=Enterococcaceae TaxID=81852 RepID=UPI00288CA161|nr:MULTISPECIES: FGGY-family carbohydrate kinase [Enterococcaceae]MDT2808767.1 FGGY family carbohydrate kinase [Vagococcus lutrae]MDV7729942.1 FGGY family carbohydrate kinase [Enterococcus faecium]